MALVRWTPLWPFEDDMERMLRDFPRDEGLQKGFIPPVDMYQTDTHVVVETPLPGVNENDVEIMIENDVLTIQGKTEKKTEVEEKNYWRKEVRTGSFYRQIALPAHVQSDGAQAVFEKGVLRVEVPKAPQSKSKKISIKGAKPSSAKPGAVKLGKKK